MYLLRLGRPSFNHPARLTAPEMIITATYRYIKGRRTRKTEETGPREAKPCRHASPDPDNTDGALSAQGVCQQCRKEKRAMRVYRTKIICGQILPYALMSLDVTM